MLRAAFHLLFRFIFFIGCRVEVHGLENIPEQGAAILASNHLGLLDAPLIFYMLKRTDSTGLAAEDYRSKPFFRLLINSVNGIWIKRDEVDLGALRAALALLKKGWLVGIAPEGTRSKTAAMIEAKTGVAYLADKAKTPIIPIAITGTEDTFDQWKRLRRPKIRALVGQPFMLAPIQRRERNVGLRRNTDEIMCQIAALLPPSYRGVYTDHPQLAALLSKKP